jgi:hypothetical protein
MRKKVDIDIYKRSVFFLFGPMDELLRDLIELSGENKNGFDNLNLLIRIVGTQSHDAVSVAWRGNIYIYTPKAVELPIAVHELSHAVHLIFEEVGMDLSDTEAYAHLLEYLFREWEDWNVLLEGKE